MHNVETGKSLIRKPLAHEHTFAEMFDKDRFVDGIPLDELGKHLRQSKTLKDMRKKRLR